MERIRIIHDQQAALLPRLQTRTDVENVRHAGTIVAFDVGNADRGYLSGIAPRLYRYFVAQGVLLRPIGQSIYMLPPYCVSAEDLEVIVGTIERALDALRDGTLEQSA
jgi:adenosylmethionine-8-amino-7-oxononanoate aminotransferase